MNVELSNENVFRSEQSLWIRYAVEPVGRAFLLVIVRIPGLRALHLSVVGFLLAVAASIAFYRGTSGALVAGAILYQAAYLFDFLDGAYARKSGRGSTTGIFLDHVFDKLRQFICLAALLLGSWRLQEDVTTWWWGFCYVFVALVDTQIPLTMRTLRQGFKLYGPGRPLKVEKAVLGVKARLARYRLRVVMFGQNERELVAFTLGPLITNVCGGLAMASTLGIGFVLLRLLLDVALEREWALGKVES